VLLQRVEIADGPGLDEFASIAHLAGAVRELVAEASVLVPRLAGRTVWMVNSTARGGGVAEMLPTIVRLMRELGVRTEWVVIGADDPAFFVLTKHIHNLIHGEGVPELGEAERALFERVNRDNAAELRGLLQPGDILVVHDPQPAPLARMVADVQPLLKIWRCHIGLDAQNVATRAAWDFLAPYLGVYDRAVFSAQEYIPRELSDRAAVIHPGIDPLASKNRDLTLHRAVEALTNGGVAAPPGPTVNPPFSQLAQRILPDGRFAPANIEDIGLLTRPIVTQVSRWDRLKGFLPLMSSFASLKRSVYGGDVDSDPRHRRRLDLVRLVLAGPDPESIQDDPEGQEVLAELRTTYMKMHPAIQDDIAVLALPMRSLEENALLVNALQRASTIIAQNSLREGFGLTITEAMWKRVPVLSNSRACGPRQQVRDGLDGRLVDDPEDERGLCRALDDMLSDPARLERWGRSAQRHAHDRFLVFTQLREWGRLIGELV
jgi:trehalose synthase